MPNVNVTLRDGSELKLSGQDGHSIMEIIRASGVDELQALCGGSCSCATCHVYVDPRYLGLLPSMSDDESDLLESSSHRGDSSRLACQIPFETSLDGIRVRIAPAE